MTSNQKFVMTLGLVAMAATTIVAPYRWNGHTSPYSAVGEAPRHGSTHAPLWAEPDSVLTTLRNERGVYGGLPVAIDGVALDAGRLGLWWAGIAAVTLVLVVLSKDTSNG